MRRYLYECTKRCTVFHSCVSLRPVVELFSYECETFMFDANYRYFRMCEKVPRSSRYVKKLSYFNISARNFCNVIYATSMFFATILYR